MKKWIITNWFVSYILILLIPFAVICFNYFYNSKIIDKEIYRSNELIADNLGSAVDECLKEAYNLHSYLYFEDGLKTLRSNETKDKNFYSDAAEFRDRLSDYRSYNARLSCMVYFPGLEYLFDMKTGNDVETYYHTYRMEMPEVLEYDQWSQMLSDTYRGEFFVKQFLHSSTSEPCLVYANSLRNGWYQPVNIFISIPVSEISDLTEKVYEGSMFLMLVDNKIQMAWGNQGVAAISDELRETYLESAAKDSEADYYFIKESSELDDRISYGMLISKKAYKREQIYVRNMFCASLVVALLVAFTVLRTLFKQRNEKTALSERLRTQEEMMQSNYLLMLMKGRNAEKYKEAVQIPKDQILVLVGIKIPELKRKQSEQDEMLFFTVDNIFSELTEGNQCYKAEDGDHLFYLFAVKEEEEIWRRECMKKAEHLNEIMSVWWKQGVFIAVSEPETELERISAQYQDIMEEFADRQLLGEACVTDICRKHRMLSANQKIVERIQELIEERYEDCNLNVTEIAEALGRTPKHISEVYKEETGDGLLHAINHKRIVKAQALMKTGQYKLSELPELTGYSNMNTFRRNFQQIVGISPSKYMEDKDFHK